MLSQQGIKEINFLSACENFVPFARQFSDLVNGNVEIQNINPPYWKYQKDWVKEATSGFELVIVKALPSAWWQRLFVSAEYSFILQAATSILFVRRPRWPIRRVLTLLLGRGEDASSVEWSLRLAQKTGATLSLIALTPPVPGIYPGMARLNQDWAALMETDTTLGRSMRLAYQMCSYAQVPAQFSVQQGSLDWLLRSQLQLSDFDLIGIGGASQGRFRQWLEGDPFKSLLRYSPRPILISKPAVL